MEQGVNLRDLQPGQHFRCVYKGEVYYAVVQMIGPSGIDIEPFIWERGGQVLYSALPGYMYFAEITEPQLISREQYDCLRNLSS